MLLALCSTQAGTESFIMKNYKQKKKKQLTWLNFPRSIWSAALSFFRSLHVINFSRENVLQQIKSEKITWEVRLNHTAGSNCSFDGCLYTFSTTILLDQMNFRIRGLKVNYFMMLISSKWNMKLSKIFLQNITPKHRFL